MTIKRVGIIGAGPSGLAAIKACLEEGLEPTAFERENELGGVWVYRDIDKVRYPSGAAVYKCLKTNTSKAFFGFTDFPSPAKWTPFVSHEKCLKYFEGKRLKNLDIRLLRGFEHCVVQEDCVVKPMRKFCAFSRKPKATELKA